MKRSKKYKELLSKYDKTKKFSIREAISHLSNLKSAKFDETVDLAVELGVDSRKSEQMIRGSVVLPHGSGKEKKILVFAEGETQVEAEEAGADWVGSEEFIQKIEDGWLECDSIVATPEIMPKIGKLGKILGPRGLMPTPKNRTVTRDIAQIVKEIKRGKIDFKIDRGGNIHLPLGKVSFKEDELYENFMEVIKIIWSLKPLSATGIYLKGITLSATMGPGVKVDVNQVRNELIQRR